MSNIKKTVHILVAVACLFTFNAFGEEGGVTAPPELLETNYLYEVVRHLYRWHLDETDAEKIVGQKKIEFWVKGLSPELDAGDQSRFGEIVIPQLDVSVTAKQADYTIEKLKVLVKNDRFKIINVSRGDLPADASGYSVVTTSYQALRDYGHRTRTLARFPEDALLMRMRLSARENIFEYLLDREKAGLKNRVGSVEELKRTEQVIHLSPLSEVANEVWIFWETGRMLIRFASDIDLENPALWDHDDLSVKLYDIDEQTVVSLDEVAGSNAYMTRDQVGRTLFNCIVLGRRMDLPPLAEDEQIDLPVDL